MKAIIKEYLTTGRAIVTGEDKQEYRVSIPVNRADLTVGKEITINSPKAVSKTVGVEEAGKDGKITVALRNIDFKEAHIELK